MGISWGLGIYGLRFKRMGGSQYSDPLVGWGASGQLLLSALSPVEAMAAVEAF